MITARSYQQYIFLVLLSCPDHTNDVKSENSHDDSEDGGIREQVIQTDFTPVDRIWHDKEITCERG